ncbi:MAG: hypothetical protein QXT64_01520 [Desulfurococcaceae archaeon]
MRDVEKDRRRVADALEAIRICRMVEKSAREDLAELAKKYRLRIDYDSLEVLDWGDLR